MNEQVIGDNTYIPKEWMDGTFARGYVPRDMASYPVGSFAPPANITLCDLKELPDRIREQEEKKSRLSDIWKRTGIWNLDQGNVGYCWAHGPVHAVMVLRMLMNQPLVPLSAYSVAATIKKGRDEGAWGALALDFIIKNGICEQKDWPQGDRKLRPLTDPMWQTAAKYKATDGWFELESPVYDRDMSKHQVLTCLIDRVPVPADSMWWGHHTCWFDVVDSYPNKSATDLSRYGIRGIHSWYQQMFFVLKDSKSVPDNAVAMAGVLAA